MENNLRKLLKKYVESKGETYSNCECLKVRVVPNNEADSEVADQFTKILKYHREKDCKCDIK